MEDPPKLHQHITDLFFSKVGFATTSPNMNMLDVSREYLNYFYSRIKKLKCELSLNYYTTQF